LELHRGADESLQQCVVQLLRDPYPLREQNTLSQASGLFQERVHWCHVPPNFFMFCRGFWFKAARRALNVRALGWTVLLFVSGSFREKLFLPRNEPLWATGLASSLHT